MISNRLTRNHVQGCSLQHYNNKKLEKSETEKKLIIKAVEVEEAKIWKVEARIEENPKTKEEKKDNQE